MRNSTNLVNEQEEKKEKRVRELKTYHSIVRALNRITNFVPIAIVGLISFALVYLLIFSKIEGIAGILDFVISGLSATTLCISVVDLVVKGKKKWITSLLFMVLPIYTLVGFMIFGMKIKDPSPVSRVISLCCLLVTLAIQSITCIVYEKRANDEVEKKTEEKIEETENGSIMDSYEKNNKNKKNKKQ